MTDITLVKTLSGLMPGDKATSEWYAKLKSCDMVQGDFRKVRNPAFHKKYFALLNIAFDIWEPGEIDSKYGKPEKNFNTFRHDLAILSGFYNTVIRLDGSVRIEAKSISFAAMEEPEFETLYSNTIDVLLKRVYGKDITRAEIDETVDKYLSFI